MKGYDHLDMKDDKDLLPQLFDKIKNDLEQMIPAKPNLYGPSDGVNPASVYFSWSDCSCENCGQVTYNLEVHQGNTTIFKADDEVGMLSQTSYELANRLQPNTTYSWAVFPESENGIWNIDVDFKTFTTGGSLSNSQPKADFIIMPASGDSTTVFTADASASSDPDLDPLEYSWNWGESAEFTSWSSFPTSMHTHIAPGTHQVTLKVRDTSGAVGFCTKPVTISTLSTLPGKTASPGPAKGSMNQSINTKLSWSGGANATSFDIYLGVSPALSASDFRGNQGSNTYDPGPLEYNKTYYWRVDAGNGVGVTQGDQWFFSTQPPPPWLAYHYWDFDTDGTEGWTARNGVSEGVYNREYWIIDPVSDPASKSGIISAPNLTALYTYNYDTIEVRAAVQSAFVDPLEAYLLIDGQWMPPIELH
ncbi:MAG: hypothetical protein B1H11_05085, partial [Desulfobacteraceae bacterium 4484_190.1]